MMSSRSGLAGAYVGAVLFSCAAVPAVAAPEAIGTVEKVQLDASATQGSQTRALAPTGPVLFKDKLRTGPGGRLEAKLEDGTVLTLGEKGKMDGRRVRVQAGLSRRSHEREGRPGGLPVRRR